MTVCIGAIFEDHSVLGASDRMLTAGQTIEFEPTQTKIWELTNYITSMVAGDILIHSQIYPNVFRVISDRIKNEPSNFWRVADVAELYSLEYSDLKRRNILKMILEPLGLTFESFISKQQEMSIDFIKDVQNKMENYSIGTIEVILAGIDGMGPHLYVVRNESVSCYDMLGFAVIGIGERHASSHFMFSQHTRYAPGEKALLIAHQAKKKSEVAPGVGKATDMFVIGNKSGFYRVKEDWIKNLDTIYDREIKAMQKTFKKSEESIKSFLMSEQKKNQAAQVASPSPEGKIDPQLESKDK